VACFVEVCALNGQISHLGSAELLKKEFFNGELSDENRFIYTLCVEYLKSGILNFSVAAGAAREEIMRRARSQSNNTNYDALGKSVDEQTLFCVLSAVKKLYDGAISPQVKELFTKQDGELAKYVSQFMQKYEKKGKKYLSECLGTLAMPEELLNVLNTAPSDKASSNGFFSKLFRK